MRLLRLLAATALCVSPAQASHGDETFTATGQVILPTFGNPIAFGYTNACDPDSPIQGIGGYSVRLPSDAPGHPFVLTGTPAQADVVWLDGPQGMSCVGLGYETRDKGTVPAKSDWAYLIIPGGRLSTVTLTINGLS